MESQELRDKNNRLLGKINDVGGKVELRDANNRLKGRYDPKTNETRDDSNRLVGKGNLLTSLLSIIVMLFCLVTQNVFAQEKSLSTILQNAREITKGNIGQVYPIFNLDVFEYFDLSDKYDTPLKKKMFIKTDEYKKLIEELKNKKQDLLEITYYTGWSHDFSEYNTKTKGFNLGLPGHNIGMGGQSANPPNSILNIYFPQLPIRHRKPYGLFGRVPGGDSYDIREFSHIINRIENNTPAGVYEEYIFISMNENNALAIENNNSENIAVYLMFKLYGNTNVQYKWFDAGKNIWRISKGNVLSTNSVRLIIGNKVTDEIYYDKTYITAPKKKPTPKK